MKKTILLISAFLILGCKTDSKTQNTEKDAVEKIQVNENIEKTKQLPKFITLNEMFENSGDFSEEVGTLKFISTDQKNLHVQVSKPIFENDLEKVKNEIVKRDIVYVAFQTFAETDISELTITSIPNSNENPKEYFEKYKQTVKVSREKAKTILNKYLGSEDFSILYEEQDGIWLPSKKFSVLKFEKLDVVFNDLK